MTRYEELINKRIEEYPWKFMYGFLDPENGTPKQVILDAVFSDFRRPLDSNCRRALKEYYTYDENGVHKRTDLGTLPVLDMPCAEYDTLPNARGVYFLGMIGTNPNGKSYYLVKIGSSDNIRTRVRQYATYNPMIYIGGYCVTDKEDAETNCHAYLRDNAYAVAMHADEWFYVEEETYYELCDTFADYQTFTAIAEGRD